MRTDGDTAHDGSALERGGVTGRALRSMAAADLRAAAAEDRAAVAEEQLAAAQAAVTLVAAAGLLVSLAFAARFLFRVAEILVWWGGT